jgi:hypothetical protein
MTHRRIAAIIPRIPTASTQCKRHYRVKALVHDEEAIRDDETANTSL